MRCWESLARDAIGKQMIRSADSIGANISESYGQSSYEKNWRFIPIACGSLYETRHWLRHAFNRKLLNDTHVIALKSFVDNLGPQLNAYLKSIGPND